jgi:hypothetical protein
MTQHDEIGWLPNQEPVPSERTARRKISTLKLATGVFAVTSVAGAAVGAGPAQALLNNRHEFWPSDSSATSYQCANPGVGHKGPSRSPSKMSVYANPGKPCGFAGNSAYAAAAVNACSGFCQEGLTLGNTRGAYVRTPVEGVTRGESAYAGCSVRNKSTTGLHWLECVSRRSFVNY